VTLAPGARLGPYEIVSLVGTGGMGEVYRALDTKLGRDVALKILTNSFTHDPERLARFRREAQLLAALNHPHIGAIHGLDEAHGQQFLVLELIDGETLAERLTRGAVAVEEALAIAKQLAKALMIARPPTSTATVELADSGGPAEVFPPPYSLKNSSSLARGASVAFLLQQLSMF
jgi:eukaryotic-like serine/threonine-protein kinase